MEEFSIRIRVVGREIDPEEITRLTGITPTDSHRRGDRGGQHCPDLVRPAGYWSVAVQDDNAERFSERLKELVEKIPNGILRNQPESGMTVEVFVGLFGIRDQSTFNIDPTTLKMIGDRGWHLVFDLYL